MADRKPDRVALVVSILALLVSAFSLWDSHHLRNLEDAKIRIQLKTVRAQWNKDSQTIVVVYRNTGEIPIAVNHAKLNFLTQGVENDPCASDLAKLSFESDDKHSGETPQGYPGDVVFMVTMPKSCENGHPPVLIGLEYSGVDSRKSSFTPRGDSIEMAL